MLLISCGFCIGFYLHSIISLLQLHHSDNLAMLAITALEIIYAFVALLVACEVCQRINLIFDECNEMVKQLEWYLFPAEIKRMLPLMLNFALEPIEIKCFGTMTSDREAFKYVRISCKSTIMLHANSIHEINRFSDYQNGIFIFHSFTQFLWLSK